MINSMKTSISEVLEQMFFLPVDLVAADDKKHSIGLERNFIAASVGFEGDPSGEFLLKIPTELAALITADFLGTLPEQLSEDQITGTVKEMINMLAGNSLSAYDADSPFNLMIPELVPAPSGNGGADAAETTVDIVIETLESRMTLHMTAL